MDDFSTITESAKGWHRADIIAAVHKRGTSLRRLAVKVGFAQSTLRSALFKPHPKANAAVADFIGVPLNELWPAWYGPDGAPLWRMTKTPTPARARPREPVRARPAANHSAQTPSRESRGRPAKSRKTA